MTKLRELVDRWRAEAKEPNLSPDVRATLVACTGDLSAALAETGWRGMDSAPKSTVDAHGRVRGVFLLGFCPDEAIDPQSCMSVIWWEPLTDGGVWYGQEAIPVRPTHWMPLPPEPPR